MQYSPAATNGHLRVRVPRREPTERSSAPPTAGSRARGPLARDLARRLERGEHVLLWGPRGSGKTTLLTAVRKELDTRRWGFSASTNSLDDITCALERAYPDTPTKGLARRAARARLWRAADAHPAVLLLDHVTRVPTAMKGWLRRLRGGLVGILLAVDIDSPRERERLRALRVGCSTVRMPPTPPRSLARQLTALLAGMGAPPASAPTRRALIRAARGRPGWLLEYAALACEEQYWRGGQLRLHLITWDTEVRLRGGPGGGVLSVESTSYLPQPDVSG